MHSLITCKHLVEITNIKYTFHDLISNASESIQQEVETNSGNWLTSPTSGQFSPTIKSANATLHIISSTTAHQPSAPTLTTNSLHGGVPTVMSPKPVGLMNAKECKPNKPVS